MDNSDARPRLVDLAQKARGRNGAAQESPPSHCAESDAPITVATHLDPAGRILVPVRINERGPFYLVANTGANTIALSEQAARRLNLPLDQERPIIVHGVTGSITVPVARVASMTLGRWPIPSGTMPILGDVFEGADGMLGLVGLVHGQLHLDLRRRKLILSNVPMPGRAEPRAVSVPMDVSESRLLVVDTKVMGTVVKTIIDTGAQSTIGNLALQRALREHGAAPAVMVPIIGVSSHRQTGVSQRLPPVSIGTLRILGARIFYGEVPLFERVGLANTPAMFLGMDVLGQMQSLTFDYVKRTVEFVPRKVR